MMGKEEAESLKKFGPKVLGQEQWEEVQRALNPLRDFGPRVTGIGPIPETPIVAPREKTIPVKKRKE